MEFGNVAKYFQGMSTLFFPASHFCTLLCKEVTNYRELHWVCKNKSTQLCKPQNMNIITTLLAVNSNSKKRVVLCATILSLVQCTPANLQERRLTATIFVGEWCISDVC